MPLTVRVGEYFLLTLCWLIWALYNPSQDTIYLYKNYGRNIWSSKQKSSYLIFGWFSWPKKRWEVITNSSVNKDSGFLILFSGSFRNACCCCQILQYMLNFPALLLQKVENKTENIFKSCPWHNTVFPSHPESACVCLLQAVRLLQGGSISTCMAANSILTSDFLIITSFTNSVLRPC